MYELRHRQKVAQIYRLLTDEQRLRLLLLMGEGVENTMEMFKLLNMPQSSLFGRLKYLTDGGLVVKQEKGVYGITVLGGYALKQVHELDQKLEELPELESYEEETIPDRHLYQRTAREILRGINEGIYKIEEPFPAERKLSESLGVSRLTLRHGLKLLTDKHILFFGRGKRRFVNPNYMRRIPTKDEIVETDYQKGTLSSK